MAHTNYKALDPAELAPVPDVPDRYGPRNEEDERVLALVRKGMASGPALPLAEVLARIDAAIQKH